jgi:hypothetical protein
MNAKSIKALLVQIAEMGSGVDSVQHVSVSPSPAQSDRQRIVLYMIDGRELTVDIIEKAA